MNTLTVIGVLSRICYCILILSQKHGQLESINLTNTNNYLITKKTMKLLTYIILAISIYNFIQLVWGILFDIYTKEVKPNNKVANNILYFSITISAYLYLTNGL